MKTFIRAKLADPVFRRALALLAHPLSLGALALMLLNDQVLRRLWPSWLTGKLSDLAWLMVVPFVLAALLAWLTPGVRPSRQRPFEQPRETWLFGLAFLLTGLGFALAKSVPAINQVATRIFSALAQRPVALLLDPSDLLALPGLAIAVALWWQTRRSSHAGQPSLAPPDPAPAAPSTRLGWRWLVLPLAALVLMADAAAPDYGIACLQQEGDRITAGSGYNRYVTQDGGLTWEYQPGAQGCPGESFSPTPPGDDWRQTAGTQPNELYRYRPGAEIQRSTDGGATWQTEYNYQPPSEAERYYTLQNRMGSPIMQAAPLDALADPSSGNMLFAMGHEGLLVRTADGQWQWRAASEYRRFSQFPTVDAFWTLLGGMLVMAVVLALLVAASLALRWTRHPLRIIVLVLAWLAWLTVDIVLAPAITTSYSATVTLGGLLVAALLGAGLLIEQLIRLAKRAPRAILPLLAIGAGVGLVYFLPYVLWLFNLLPNFGLTTAVALLLLAAGVVGGVLWVRRLPAAQVARQAPLATE